MNTNTNSQVVLVDEPDLTVRDLTMRGGGKPDSERPVVFRGPKYTAPGEFAQDPLASIPDYEEKVRSQYEFIDMSESFTFGFNDVACAMTRVLMKLGPAQSKSLKPGQPPQERIVETGIRKNDAGEWEMGHMTVPSEWMTIPQLPDGLMKCMPNPDGTGTVVAKIHRFQSEAIDGIFAFIRDELATNSIYRGQVINERFEFIDMTKFRPERVVYNQNIKGQLGAYGLNVIVNTEKLESEGCSTNVGLLLYGPAGTGKSLFISVVAQTAFLHDVTCVMATPGTGLAGLEQANNICRMYQDGNELVVLVVEDFETIGKQHRGRALELLDSAQDKGKRRLLVGTTNFPDQLEPAMYRPGRFDHLIPVDLPDRPAFEQLISQELEGRLKPDLDFDEVFPAFADYTPAWIVGSTNSVIAAAIWENGSADEVEVDEQALINAANSYRPQHELQLAATNRVEPLPTLDQALKRMVYESMDEVTSNYTFTTNDETDYSRIADDTDTVIENRVDQATIDLEDTENGHRITGRLRTQ